MGLNSSKPLCDENSGEQVFAPHSITTTDHSEDDVPVSDRSEDSEPKTVVELFERLSTLRSGSKEYVELLTNHDGLMDSNCTKVSIWEDGCDLPKKLGKFDHVHLFKSKEGLGLEIPQATIIDPKTKQSRTEEIDFGNALTFFNKGKKLGVVDSLQGVTEERKLSDLMDPILKELRTGVKEPREEVLNILSLEVSEEKKFESFKPPPYVAEMGMIEQIRRGCNAKMKYITKERKRASARFQGPQQEEELERLRSTLNEEAKTVRKVQSVLPHVEKFLLFSMRGSYTAVHVDFSATAVFYHVVRGKKVFYVAPPTAENLDMYKKSEVLDGEEKRRCLEGLITQYKKVEIPAGHTIFLPAGYLHAVLTPEDSIVVGGNFLRRESVDLQFEMSRFELESDVEKIHVLGNFFPSMFAFLKYVLLPVLEAGNVEPLDANVAETFSRELKDVCKNDDEMFAATEKKKLHAKLETLLRRHRKRAANVEPESPPEVRRRSTRKITL